MTSNLDQVLERINILDVVSQYVKLRKAGRNFVGLCPFHQEKTPSFTVSIEKQIYYCFGCHEGGNAVNFISKYERITFFEALEGLASQVGIEIDRKGESRRKPTFDALIKLSGLYQDNLRHSSTALKYLSDRGIHEKTITHFGLGYAERRNYGKDFSKHLGAPVDLLLSAGILKTRDNGEIYDIFRGRITIPILDANGKVIGFGGRGIEKDALPKYINSPESSVFIKRAVLYGLDKAKRDISAKDHAIVVEGYFDLISLHQSGVTNAVATLGTAITSEQILRLRNFSENITLMLDGDDAGIKSALRLISVFSEMELSGNMIVLPDGHDPDSFIRAKGTDAFLEMIGKKRPILDCFFEITSQRLNIKTLEGRLAFIKTVLPYVENIKDAVKRQLYIHRLSELTGVEESLFLERHQETAIGKMKSDGNGSENTIERTLVGVALNRPEFVQNLVKKGVKKHIRDVDLKVLLDKAFEFYEKNGNLELKLFLNMLDEPMLREKALRSAMDVSDYSEIEAERLLSDYLNHVENARIREEANRITESLAEAEKKGDEKALLELLEKKRQIVTAMKFKSTK
jgi:DNA primase